MIRAFSEEWVGDQARLCREDTEFQTKIAKFNRSVTVHILPSPERGVAEECTFGFDFPGMRYYSGAENAWETDYVLEGDYDAWYRVNEGIDELVPALMDQKIGVPRGSVSYVARFLPAIERYFQLARSHTEEYAGDFEPVASIR